VKELKAFRLSSFLITFTMWNPVKELKVYLTESMRLNPGPRWNPVKELKVHAYLLPPTVLTHAWNPVKELKGFHARRDELALLVVKWNPVKELKG